MTDTEHQAHSGSRIASRVTSLRDVAELAGVSVSTASRVLSGSTHPVSDAARRRVTAAAEQLGFEPNRLARALATARSQTIGVVVHDVSDPYFAELIRGLEDVAGPRDHSLFVSSSDREPSKELSVVRAFVASRVDAIVLAASGLTDPGYLMEMSSLLSRYEENGGVVVAIAEQRYPDHRVAFDNAAATASAVDHLVSLGHRRVGYLSGPTNLEVSARRYEGFLRGLETHGIPNDPKLVECGWFSMEGGARATERLLDRADPTALLAANDLMAIGALRVLRDSGVEVPEQISVAGFDDIEFAAYAPVPLTTVRMPLAELGRAGAQMALDLLGGNQPASPRMVSSRLIVRHSTGPAP
ncbi:MAG: LacI family DNA-binding transcriptional regulator [Actinomycetota bacterium]